jgi:hypothetical protein
MTWNETAIIIDVYIVAVRPEDLPHSEDIACRTWLKPVKP